MANENPNAKWITVHPNGKEEKPGIRVAINAAGKVEKGPKGLKDAINANGGLPGAKSVPLDELKAQEQEKTEEPDFTAPSDDDFSALFEEPSGEAPAFTPPSDDEFSGLLDDEENGEDPSAILAKNLMGGEEKESPFPPAAVEKYVNSKASLYSYDDEKKAKLTEIVNQHPELFKMSDDGDLVTKDTESWYKIGTLMKGETDAPAAAAPKFTEEMIEAYGMQQEINGVGTKDAWQKVIHEHPELFEVGKCADTGNNFISIKGYNESKAAMKFMKQALKGEQSSSAPTEQESGVEGTAASTQPPAPQTNPLPPPPPAKPVSAELTEGGYPFPKDSEALSGLTIVPVNGNVKIGNLGGASGAHATLYKDADGNMFVMKRFDPSDKAGQQRIKEECDADAYYLAGGANVPHFKLYGDETSGYTKLSQYIPGTKTLGSVWKSADKALQEKIRANLSQNFALDVMAGAWDVLGTGMDNVLVDKDGNVWRCDNGGAFNRRAQGGEKDEANWGSGHIDDLWTMRGKAAGLDGKTVPDGTGKAEMFGGITTHQLLSDIASRDWDKMIAHLPDATRQVMAKRIANAKEYHGVCDNVVTAGMYGDGQHSEDITLNYHCLNKFGAKPGCTNENLGPKNWGFCRGKGEGNPAPTLSKYLKEEPPKLSDLTGIAEPKLESYLPNGDVNQAANILLAAGKTINFHTATTDKDGKENKNMDGKPDMAKVDAALALKPKLEAVAKGTDANAKMAKEMLAYVQQIEKLKGNAVDGKWPSIVEKLGHSPSGAVDLNTPESKAAAEEAFKTAHAEWENKVANAKGEFAKAEAAYAKKKKAAEKKLATAMKKWKAENGGKAFKWNNLTDCYEDFCKQNGIESKLFWEMAGSQAGSSQGKGSARMKVLEIIAMGGNLDNIFKSVEGVSDHTTDVYEAAKEFKSNPALFEKYGQAYRAMKSLTMMFLTNSGIEGKEFISKGHIVITRTEPSDVGNLYSFAKHLGKMLLYPKGSHDSTGAHHTVFPFSSSKHIMMYNVPFSRISSLYYLKNPKGSDMYLGDGENEFGTNLVGLYGAYVGYKTANYKFVDANGKEVSGPANGNKSHIPKATFYNLFKKALALPGVILHKK